MSRPDRMVERAAERLEGVAEKAAVKGGLAKQVAPALEEDADFLRKLAPSKVRRRMREDTPSAPRARVRPAREGGGLMALAAAFALGVLVAKLVEWRSYVE